MHEVEKLYKRWDNVPEQTNGSLLALWCSFLRPISCLCVCVLPPEISEGSQRTPKDPQTSFTWLLSVFPLYFENFTHHLQFREFWAANLKSIDVSKPAPHRFVSGLSAAAVGWQDSRQMGCRRGWARRHSDVEDDRMTICEDGNWADESHRAKPVCRKIRENQVWRFPNYRII